MPMDYCLVPASNKNYAYFYAWQISCAMDHAYQFTIRPATEICIESVIALVSLAKEV